MSMCLCYMPRSGYGFSPVLAEGTGFGASESKNFGFHVHMYCLCMTYLVTCGPGLNGTIRTFAVEPENKITSSWVGPLDN